MGTYRRTVRGQKLRTHSAKFAYRGKLYQRHGFPDRDAAQHWLDTTRLSLRRGEIGYVKVRRDAAIVPLIEKYAAYLASNRRDDKYCQTSENRLKRLAKEVPWQTTGDLNADGLERWRSSRPTYRTTPLKPKTLNQFLDHAMQFGDWLLKVERAIAVNPFLSLARMNAPTNGKYRRAGTLAEVASLLKAAPAERAIIYLFMFYAPLRREAIEGITWADLSLDGERPTLTLPARLSKSRHEAKMAIRADLAAKLIAFRAEAADDDRVFVRVPTVDQLRTDLAAAGVAFDDGKGGRRLDLHAFRKTCIRALKNAGVSLDEAHVFLQHRDRRTTERHYDDDRIDAGVMTAAEKMPSLSLPNGLGAQSGAQNEESQ